MRILWVDEEGTVVRLVELLGLEGHQVTRVETGSDALEHLLDQDVDIIILDMMLPPGVPGLFEADENSVVVGETILAQVLDGKIVVGARVRHLDPPPPVIVVTGKRAESYRARFGDRCQVLGKPVDLDELLLAVQRVGTRDGPAEST